MRKNEKLLGFAVRNGQSVRVTSVISLSEKYGGNIEKSKKEKVKIKGKNNK